MGWLRTTVNGWLARAREFLAPRTITLGRPREQWRRIDAPPPPVPWLHRRGRGGL